MTRVLGNRAIQVGWIAMLAFPVACEGPEAASPDLPGSRWQVQDYADPADPSRMISALSGAPPSLEFGQDGSVRGTGGCNTFHGSYRVQGDSLRFGPLASTMMYCGDPEGVMEQEAAFLSTLESAEAFSFDSGALKIKGPGGSIFVSLVPSPEGGAEARNEPGPGV